MVDFPPPERPDDEEASTGEARGERRDVAGEHRPRFVPDDAWRPSEERHRRPGEDQAAGERPAEEPPAEAGSRPAASADLPPGTYPVDEAAGARGGRFYSLRLAEYGSWPTVLGMLLLAIFAANVFGVVLTIPALLSGDEDVLTNSLTLALLIGLQAIVFVGTVYLVLIRRGVTSWAAMGFGPEGPGNAFLRGTGWGLLFILVASVVGALQNVLLGLDQEQALPFPMEGVGTLGRIAILVGGVILAPLSEEIFFRGYIFRAMASRKGVVRGVIYSSLLFGAIHLIRDWPPDLSPFLPIALGSTLLAIAYHRSGNIWTPIVAHAVNNAFAFSVLFLAS